MDGKFRYWACAALLALGIWVALSPGTVYAPTPRNVLYLLIALIPAMLFGAELAAKVEVKLWFAVLSGTGIFAAIIAILILLTYFTKPDVQIAVFSFVDKNKKLVSLDRDGVFTARSTSQGMSVTPFLSQDSVALIFPEQVTEIDVAVQPQSGGSTYEGTLTYTGSRKRILTLGVDLHER